MYKGLALVAFAQLGKQPSDKLFENSESQGENFNVNNNCSPLLYKLHNREIITFCFALAELPVPVLGDISEVCLLAQRLHKNNNPTTLNLTYSDICNLDTIEVNLVPEKKGIFLKHVEYQVTSKVS